MGTRARAVHPFDAATAVLAAGPARWRAPLDRDWFGTAAPGTAAPHGGHLAAQLLAAMIRHAGDPELSPRALTRPLDQRRRPGRDGRRHDVQRLPFPVTAAVNGHCMGGGFELALDCDIRVAAEQARFRGADVRVGLIASTARLTHLLGPAVAKDVLLTGRTFDGSEALRLGVVSAAVPLAQLLDEARRRASMIASRAPLAVRRTKLAIDAALDLSFADTLSQELDYFAEPSGTEDHNAAVAAFFRRQEPEFHGR
jgi:enoyl-CoA hydratase/carnithine racemase